MRAQKKDETKSLRTWFLLGLFIFLAVLAGYYYLDFNSNNLEQVNYTQDFPEIYAGTEDGGVYYLRPGETPVLQANVGRSIHGMEFRDSKAFISAGTEKTKSEITVFHEGEKKVIELEGFTHGVASSNGLLYIANHGAGHANKEGHGSKANEEHTHDEDSQSELDLGHIAIYDLGQEQVINRIPLESAYKIENTDNGILAMGAAGELMLLDSQTGDLKSRIDVGTWTGGMSSDGENILTTSRRRVISDGPSENVSSITVRNGYLGVYNLEGEELKRIDFGISSMPHDVQRYNESTVIVTDLAGGKLRFVELDNNHSTTLRVGDHPMELVIKDNLGFVADSTKDKVYKVNLETREIESSVDIPGLTLIREPPSSQITWK